MKSYGLKYQIRLGNLLRYVLLELQINHLQKGLQNYSLFNFSLNRIEHNKTLNTVFYKSEKAFPRLTTCIEKKKHSLKGDKFEFKFIPRRSSALSTFQWC